MISKELIFTKQMFKSLVEEQNSIKKVLYLYTSVDAYESHPFYNNLYSDRIGINKAAKR